MFRLILVGVLCAHPSLAANGHGDCQTGCKSPVQSQINKSLVFSDCVKWFQGGCPNNVWPGDPKQPGSCPVGANAIAFSEDDGLCRAWACNEDHDYDGNPSFSCVYQPGSTAITNDASSSYYPPLVNVCLKDDPSTALTELNGAMTPNQAAEACSRYVGADGKTQCAGYWYDSQSPVDDDTPTGAEAPCRITLTKISDTEWKVSKLDEYCSLHPQEGDPMGDCGYQGHDDWCCIMGDCSDVYKQCGHITYNSDPNQGQVGFGYMSCGGDGYQIQDGEVLAPEAKDSDATVTCTQKDCKATYLKRYMYYFYSQFQPVDKSQTCGTGASHRDAALQFSGDAPKVPIAVQNAYHFYVGQMVPDMAHPQLGMVESDYASAMLSCMRNGQCNTFSYTCLDDSYPANPKQCTTCRNGVPCPDKFPQYVNMSFSTFDDSYLGSSGVSSTYFKARRVRLPSAGAKFLV